MVYSSCHRLDFGDHHLGHPSPQEYCEIMNDSTEECCLSVVRLASTRGPYDEDRVPYDEAVARLSSDKLAAGSSVSLKLSLAPRRPGTHNFTVSLRATGASFSSLIEIDCCAQVFVPEQGMYRFVAPQEEGTDRGQERTGKRGAHPFVSMANTTFFRHLVRQGAILHHYPAIPGGTRRGKVWNRSPGPGEVDVYPVPGSGDYSRLACFDLQSISTHWPANIGSSLPDWPRVSNEVREAVRHVLWGCHAGEDCRHCGSHRKRLEDVQGRGIVDPAGLSALGVPLPTCPTTDRPSHRWRRGSSRSRWSTSHEHWVVHFW